MIAHDNPAAPLEYGVWLCDCGTCRSIMLAQPQTILVVKCGSSRARVKAGDLARTGAEHWIDPRDYVREVFVAS